jgi:hypothetical protein
MLIAPARPDDSEAPESDTPPLRSFRTEAQRKSEVGTLNDELKSGGLSVHRSAFRLLTLSPWLGLLNFEPRPR